MQYYYFPQDSTSQRIERFTKLSKSEIFNDICLEARYDDLIYPHPDCWAAESRLTLAREREFDVANAASHTCDRDSPGTESRECYRCTREARVVYQQEHPLARDLVFDRTVKAPRPRRLPYTHAMIINYTQKDSEGEESGNASTKSETPHLINMPLIMAPAASPSIQSTPPSIPVTPVLQWSVDSPEFHGLAKEVRPNSDTSIPETVPSLKCNPAPSIKEHTPLSATSSGTQVDSEPPPISAQQPIASSNSTNRPLTLSRVKVPKGPRPAPPKATHRRALKSTRPNQTLNEVPKPDLSLESDLALRKYGGLVVVRWILSQIVYSGEDGIRDDRAQWVAMIVRVLLRVWKRDDRLTTRLLV